MSRNIPARSAVAAIVVGVVTIGLLISLILWGKHAQGDSPAGAGHQVPDGFSSIEAEEIFSTIAQAQKDAGSWQVTSVSTVQGQQQPSGVVQVQLKGEQKTFRISMTTQAGVIEGLWDGERFYEKSPNGDAAKPWYVYPEETFNPDALASLTSDIEAMTKGYDIVEDEVVGSETVTDLEGNETEAVQYRLVIEPSADATAAGVDPATQRFQLDLWLDADNRPVQLQSTDLGAEASAQSASQMTTYYSQYGETFDLTAPAADQVTDKAPTAQ
ncbi:hypothetical protein NODU109028_12315 [Nocardioides dubius]|uniref:LppX_LprAFG lipoprotein n=1 Tax=Nocardioides dubius TaxID=317019 RepID=A0ABN1TQR9_9ACTN